MQVTKVCNAMQCKLLKLSMQNFGALVTWPSPSLELNLSERVWAFVKWELNQYLTPTKQMLQSWECVRTSFFPFHHS